MACEKRMKLHKMYQILQKQNQARLYAVNVFSEIKHNSDITCSRPFNENG